MHNQLILGDTNFVNSKIAAMKKEIFQGDSPSIREYDASDARFSVADVVGTCQTVPMFDPQQLVVVKNCYKFLKEAEQAEVDYFCNYLKNPTLSSFLILSDPKFNKKTRLFKSIKKFLKVVEAPKPKRSDDAFSFVYLLKKKDIKKALELLNRFMIYGIPQKGKPPMKNRSSVAALILGALGYDLRKNQGSINQDLFFKRHKALREADLNIKSSVDPFLTLTVLVYNYH